MRNFGHIIKNLGICLFSTNEKLCIEIENYLTRYCSDSLERLLLVGNQTIVPFEHLPKPLKNVTVVKVTLNRGQHINHIRFINERNLPNVNNIEIFWGTRDYQEQELLKFHFENIEYFAFGILKPVSMNIFSFGNLKHLRLEGIRKVDDSVCQLIGSIKDLKTIRIGLFGSVEQDSLGKFLRLQNILSTVVEFTIRSTGCTTEDVLYFLKKSRKLRKLRFIIWRILEYGETKWLDFMETISTSLPHNWSSRIEEISREESEFTLDSYFILEKTANG